MLDITSNNEDPTYQSTCDIFECSLRSLKRWVSNLK